MTVHSMHIFDRRGKTLYTKRYSDAVIQQHKQLNQGSVDDEEQLSEQRKLIFGMLFSLRELVGSLSPDGEPASLHAIRTGASTLHNFETLSGLRFAMFTCNDCDLKKKSNETSVRKALQYIYSDLWVECVVRSPLYRPGSFITFGEMENGSGASVTPGKFDIRSTHFEKKLDEYLASMPWFR